MKSDPSVVAEPSTLVLGLDIGAASIGWALVETNNGSPARLRALGVRIFEEGVEGFNSPKEKSRAAPRREARSRRRMTERTRRRLTKLAHCLQRGGLLPPGDLGTPEALHAYFLQLDRSLFPSPVRKADPHRMHYRLRARALAEKLSEYEIGRALYHLAQRRGFKSNRKALGKGREDDRGTVKTGIKTLQQEMEAANAKTLGEYFGGIDPEKARIRDHYLHRETMVRHEFNLIWQSQASHHPNLLTHELRAAVHDPIFFQRPLKTPERFIRLCELEQKERRAAFTDLAAQRFRLLQKVNDLRYISADGSRRLLTPEERAKLVGRLETKEKMPFDAIRKALKLSGGRFNFETFGETGIVGNRTGARLAKPLSAKRWKALSAEERAQVVEEFCALDSEQALREWGVTRLGLDDRAVAKLLEVGLESGHCNLSRKALDRVLPHMEKGVAYSCAVASCYPDRARAAQRSLLAPLRDVVDVRNPAVERALTELRKVVNAIIRQYGKPGFVRIELARDLKRNRKQRQAITVDIKENEKQRQVAIADLERMGYPPTGWNIEKWLLWEECNHQCPYTGSMISPVDLFGDPPQFQVEHIIPPELCPALGNSFFNKTLCHVRKNQEKGNRTPWQAFGDNPGEWDLMIGRVSKFRGRGTRQVQTQRAGKGGRGKPKPFVHPKLELLQLKDPQDLDDFTRRQLTDTQYAARLGVRYVGQLYGAGVDGVGGDNRKRVEARRAGLTGQLRRGWLLEREEGKRRSDHRQHAVDAVCIALADSARVKQLSDAWHRGWCTPGQRPQRLDAPWPDFRGDVANAVDKIIVSHRVARKLSAALHDELPWSPRRSDPDGRTWAHQRKPVHKLSAKEVADIVDCKVRRCVQDKLRELGKSDPKEAFKSQQDHPRLLTRKGRSIPIHKVRVRKPDPTVTIGAGSRQREVVLGSNHHMEVIKTSDRKGREMWKGLVVSRYEASQRVRAARKSGGKSNAAVETDPAGGGEFLFSLAQGETVELDENESGKRRFYVVTKITKRVPKKGAEVHTVGIVEVNDARPSTGKDKANVRALEEPSAEVLRKRHCRKVVVTPLGEVRRAND